MDFALLGPLEVRDPAGRRLDMGSRRQRALLAMLLLEANSVVAAERLVDGLWGEHPPARAIASVQSYVSNLRRVLEPGRRPRAAASVLVSRGTGYALLVDPHQLDVLAFEEGLGRAAVATPSRPEAALVLLDAALALWRGPALAEFAAEPFAGPQGTRLEARRATAEEDRVDLLLGLDRTSEAIGDLERLVQREPLRERRQHQLVLALYRAGRQVEALEAHRRHVTALADEYGLDPSPAFLALRDAVLRHDLPVGVAETPRPAPAPVVPSRSTVAATRRRAATPAPPLVGRDAELERLRAVLDRAEHGAGGIVLVSGEPGIGKSRLLEAVLEEAGARGMLAALGRCYEGGGAPAFWPFVEVARALGEATGDDPARHAALAGEVAALLDAVQPERGRADPAHGMALLVEPASRFLVADRIMAALHAIAAHAPLVVALDDVYGADPDSLDALVRLGPTLGVIPVVVVATLRTSALPDGHPLASALGELVRLSHVERVAPRRLRIDETRLLLAGEAGVTPDEATVSRVHERTDGNPFFTVEMARLLRTDGADLDREVPVGVRDVLRLRLSRLPPGTQAMLRTAAVQGRTFSVDVVAAVQGASLPDTLEHVEIAIAAQLVGEDRGRPGRYRFSHVLVQDAIVDAMSALRRARLHHDVAEALAPLALGRPELWVQVAHHAAQAVAATGPELALVPLCNAALQAVSVDAHELGQQLVEQRIALVATLPPGRDRDLAELQAQNDLCAVLPVTTGWHAPALETASRRVQELGLAVDDLDAVTRGLSAASAHATVTGRYDVSLGIHPRQAAIFARTGDPAHGFLAAHGVAMVHLFRGELTDAAREYATADELLAIADPDDAGALRIPPDRMSGAAHHASLWALARWMVGDVEGSARQLDRAHEIALRVGHLQTIWAVWLSHLNVAYCAHDPQAAVAGDHQRRQEASTLRSPLVDALIGVPAAWGAALLGERGAADTAATLVAELTATGALVFAALHRGMVADALLHDGRDDEALAAASEGLAMADRLGERMWEAELHRLRAVALQRQGRMPEAAAALAAARITARFQGAGLLLGRVDETARGIEVLAAEPTGPRDTVEPVAG